MCHPERAIRCVSKGKATRPTLQTRNISVQSVYEHFSFRAAGQTRCVCVPVWQLPRSPSELPRPTRFSHPDLCTPAHERWERVKVQHQARKPSIAAHIRNSSTLCSHRWRGACSRAHGKALQRYKHHKMNPVVKCSRLQCLEIACPGLLKYSLWQWLLAKPEHEGVSALCEVSNNCQF